MFASIQLRGNDRLVDAATNIRVMKKGEAGLAVRIVQQALIDLGYPMPKTVAAFGTPDGIYGKETKAKVRKFQEDEKLPDWDGIVGQQSLTRIDELLSAKKIPAKPLPPLPPGSPGNSTDSAADSVLVIRDVLSLLNPLAHLPSFGVTMHQTVTEEGKPLEKPIVHRATILGNDYLKIAELITDGTIPVVIEPSLTAAALYVPQALSASQAAASGIGFAVPQGTLVLSRALDTGRADRFVIIHEATHAICDRMGRGEMNALFSELLAFVAEALYSRKRFGGGKGGHRAYEMADIIAEKLLRGAEPSIEDVDNLAVNVRWETTYGKFTTGTVQYWGLDD